MGQFARRSSITLATQVSRLFLGIVISIIIARILGPQGKGVYTMCTLFPLLILTVSNLGIAPASAYYLASRHYSSKEILGNNIVFSAGIGMIGMIFGIIITIWFRNGLFPAIPPNYLFFSLLLIPVSLLFQYIQAIFLGLQRFREYNLANIIYSGFYLILTVVALLVLHMDIWGVLAANFLAWSLATLTIFNWAKKNTQGVSYKLNRSYIKEASKYGIQAHIGNIFAFLNYRIDMLIVNYYLNPLAVGFYSISVLIAEKLWMLSSAASMVLFPRIAAEKDEQKKKEFTPLVVRSVVLLTIISSLALYICSYWLIVFLYSREYLPAVKPLKILLPGIIALSASRVIANDIAGRGRPLLNSYIALGVLVTNIILNLIWIPKYGIEGAALASTISYTIALIAQIVIYCRLSDNLWTKVLLPQRGDWALYRGVIIQLRYWLWTYFHQKGKKK